MIFGWAGSRAGGMARALGRAPLIATGCLAGLVVACYGRILFGGHQFAFRDAARFYYPMYWRVQQEWLAGRLPLWEPGVNGGQPMLGSPMAAALYPGKLIFALLPYDWGLRLYTVGHEILAFGAMAALLRSWRVSGTGATLGGLSYAFGGPVFSGYFNVIYLVGAAWIPLGFRAADRWLRQGRRWGLVELAVVLAMQVLGGDPESAYLTTVCALGYAVALARREDGVVRPWVWMLGLVLVAMAWMGAGPLLSRLVRGLGGAWQVWTFAGWGLAILAYAATRPPGRRARLGGLLVAVTLAVLLAGAQVVPALESIAGSIRWAGAGPMELYDSSLVPYRVLEWIWPNVFGTFTAGNHYWVPILPPAGAQRPSPLSLYAGALPVVLALGASGPGGGPPWRTWVAAVALLGLWGAVGQFAGASGWSSTVAAGAAGDDSFYGLLAAALPGLRLFRFPFKLLPLTCLGLAALAGAGWDRFVAGEGRRRTFATAAMLLSLALLGLAAVATIRPVLVAAFAARGRDHAVFGPLDPAGAVGEILRSLGQGALSMAGALGVLAWASRRDRAAAAAIAPIFLAVDLAVAHAPLVITVPQGEFDREPEVLRAIRQAERDDPSPGPFRVHRLPSWVPIGWARTRSPRRLRELVDWEIDTLQPRLGWLHGVEYVYDDESEIAPVDLRHLFQPESSIPEPALAAELGIRPDRPILLHARGSLDLWGARYFIIPAFPGDWDRPNRSYAALLDQTDLIYPDPASMGDPGRVVDRQRWLLTRDVQVRRNRRAFPRTWVVHEARIIPTIDPAHPEMRDALLARLRSASPFAAAAAQGDPRDEKRIVTIEAPDPAELAASLADRPTVPAATPPERTDRVAILESNPSRVILRANTQRPALVILADRYDSGWQLTVDGHPARILRANFQMRAALVKPGTHTLIYSYVPASARIGGLMTLAGLAVLAAMMIWARVPSPFMHGHPVNGKQDFSCFVKSPEETV